MTDIDKFYSDGERIMKRAAAAQTGNKKIAEDLARLFQVAARGYDVIAESLSNYWIATYADGLSGENERKAAIEWFANVLALFDGEFMPDMDFEDRDWDEIRETVSAEAETLNLDVLTSIMTVIVERKKT